MRIRRSFHAFAAMAMPILTVLLSAMPALGNTVTVANTDDSGPGSLRAAIDSAGPGDTIVFALTYPAVISLTTGSLTINTHVTIVGPGAFNLTIDASTNNFMARAITIGSGMVVSISGVTVTGGRGGGTSAGSIENSGGGIFNGGTLTLSDVVVSNNSTRNQGPGGGGIFNAGGATLTLIDSIVSGNMAGGTNVQESALVAGGGIRNASDALLTLVNTAISNNWAQVGGGIWNNGSLEVTGSTFSGNGAGVGISTTAVLEGGAIYAGSGQSSSRITNSTFFNNGAKTDGAAVANRGTMEVSHSTFAGNATEGGTGAAVTSLGNTLTLKASILANPPQNCSVAGGLILSSGYNLTTDASCSLTGAGDVSNVPADLDPAGLQDNGGPTKTIGLLSTSAAVDLVPTPCTDIQGDAIGSDQRGVVRPQGSGCDAGAVELIRPEPTLTSFTPSSGRAGTSVTITGSAFLGATAVTFNGTTASFSVDSDTQISAVAPVGAATGPIAVTTPDGTAVSAANFIVLSDPVPTITSFSPQSGGVGTSVTINGMNLSGTTRVTFAGTSAAFTISNSGKRITAVVPAGAESGPIAITTAAGTATSAGIFTVVAAPSIASVAPSSGRRGSSVTITGTNFTGATAVRFGSKSASFSVAADGTQITAIVPKLKAGAMSISVITPGGTATAGTPFTVIK